MPPLPELNEQQRDAVESQSTRLVIVAGPGTGKTRTLTCRLAHLLGPRGIPAENILAVTFTRSAAGEMRERLRDLLQGSRSARLSELWVETFHAAALRILRQEHYPFGPGVEFSVASDEEKAALLDGLVPRREAPALLEDVRRRKQSLELPSNGSAGDYQKRLESAKRLDFDDLILHACRLFDENPEALGRWRRRFQHVLVDEFQDTSAAQYAWLRKLAPENLCAIGDPDQAIYGFAGDFFSPLERFRRDFPDCRVLPLCENYRSKAAILEAAKQVIGKNRAQLPRILRARMEQGLPIEISAHRTARQEAEMIAKRIEGLLGGASYFTIDSAWAEKEEESYAYGLGDIVILYRFHVQARAIEEALHRAGLPYRTYGKTLREDGEEVSATQDLEDFRENLGASPSAAEPSGQRIALMTLHRSKGLEFPVVFLAGCEEGVLPYRRSQEQTARRMELEEERRLFYVGMTRAKNRLFLSHAQERTIFGRTLTHGASSFLRDIAEELRILRESRAHKKGADKPEQPSLFP